MKLTHFLLFAMVLLTVVPYTSAAEEEEDVPESMELTYPYPVGDDDTYFEKGNFIKQLTNGNILIAGRSSPEDDSNLAGLLLEIDAATGEEVWYSNYLNSDSRYNSEYFTADEFGKGKWLFAAGDSKGLPFDLSETGVYDEGDDNNDEEEEDDTSDNSDYISTSAIFSKVESDGKIDWTEVAGDNLYEHRFVTRSVILNANGDAIVAVSTRPIYRTFVAKISKAGDLIWGKEISGQIQNIVATSDGQYVISGVARYGNKACAQNVWSRCGARLFYVWLNEDGVFDSGKLWGLDLEELNELSDDANANARVLDSDAVETDEKADENADVEDSDEKTEFSQIYGAASAVTSDNGFIFTGETSVSNGIYVLKVDSEGEHQWAKFLSHAAGGAASSFGITQTRDGGYVLTGTVDGELNETNNFDFTASTSKALIVKLDSDGEIVWSKQWALESHTIAQGNSIIESEDGAYWVTGFVADGVHASTSKLNDMDPFDVNSQYTSPQLFVLKIAVDGSIEYTNSLSDVELASKSHDLPAMIYEADFTHLEVLLSKPYPKQSIFDDLLNGKFTLFNVLLVGGVIIAFLILIVWGVCLKMGKKSEEKKPLGAEVELGSHK